MSNDDMSLSDLSPNVIDDWERWASDRPDRETKQDANERKIIALCRAVRVLRAGAEVMGLRGALNLEKLFHAQTKLDLWRERYSHAATQIDRWEREVTEREAISRGARPSEGETP